jgi:hypothetical protein
MLPRVCTQVFFMVINLQIIMNSNLRLNNNDYDPSLLGRYTVPTGEQLPTFRNNVLLSSSETNTLLEPPETANGVSSLLFDVDIKLLMRNLQFSEWWC